MCGAGVGAGGTADRNAAAGRCTHRVDCALVVVPVAGGRPRAWYQGARVHLQHKHHAACGQVVLVVGL